MSWRNEISQKLNMPLKFFLRAGIPEHLRWQFFARWCFGRCKQSLMTSVWLIGDDDPGFLDVKKLRCLRCKCIPFRNVNSKKTQKIYPIVWVTSKKAVTKSTTIPSILQSHTRPKAIARFLGQTPGRAPCLLSSERHQKELIVTNEPAWALVFIWEVGLDIPGYLSSRASTPTSSLPKKSSCVLVFFFKLSGSLIRRQQK